MRHSTGSIFTISGAAMRLSRIMAIGCLMAGFLFPPAMAGEPSPLPIGRLAEIISGVPDHTASFRETRRLTLLSEPVELEGTLVFRAPDHLEKHTLAPQREDLVVDGGWVTVSLPGQNNEMQFNIADDPVLQGLLFSLQKLLNGEPSELTDLFAVEAWGSAVGWTLRLKPKMPEMQKRVQAVRVKGEGRWIRTLELWETSGDYMIMTIDAESPG